MSAALFSCVAENRRGFCDEVTNLALSIRNFGGDLADAPIVANFVEGIDREFERPLLDLDVTVRVVDRFDPRSPPLNKLRMLELADEAEFDTLVALDTDTLVARDLSPLLGRGPVAAAYDLESALTDAQWTAVFDELDVPQPDRRVEMLIQGSWTVPYFNTGVMLVARDECRPLLDSWSTTARRVLDAIGARDELEPALAWFTDQVSFAVNVAAQGLDVSVLTPTEHFQSERRYPEGAVPTERPFVVHYMRQIAANGFLEASQHLVANPVHDSVNRLRAAQLGVPYRSFPSRPLSDRAVAVDLPVALVQRSGRPPASGDAVARAGQARVQVPTAPSARWAGRLMEGS